jgi:hypothetical protein
MRTATTLGWLVALYGIASLIHFAHNAEHIADYPNLPAWITRGRIYAAWLATMSVGAAGWLLHQRGWPRTGLILVGVSGVCGFDGLLHYTRAPFAMHSTAMHASIWFEAATAGLLFAATVLLAVRPDSEEKR